MTFQLVAKITPHPRISTAVEFSVTKDGFEVESGVATESTLEKSVAMAKSKINRIYPELNTDGIYVHVPAGS